MKTSLMAAFAAVALDAGLGLRAGAKLRIAGSFPNRELMHAIARGAYERGASLVRIEYDDEVLARTRADFSRDEYLDESSLLMRRMCDTYAEEGWSLLSLAGDEDPDAMQGADEAKLTRMQRARGTAVEKLRIAQMSSRLPWCVMPAATDAWARNVLGPGADSDALWEILSPILRLDRADPAAELREHMEVLEARARALDAWSLRELRFEAPGTELVVALAPESRWIGGSDRTPEGIGFMPNIPTEETFATPDFRGTEGYAALSRPVRIHGSIVAGGRLRFEGGRVVDCSADRGCEALESYLETDEGARRLGEVALVDSASPIGKSGLVFDSALIDENAACHIALGCGYDLGFEGALGWSDEEKAARGFNVSIVHEDLMIGGPEMDATGIDAGGREVPLMRRGSYIFSS